VNLDWKKIKRIAIISRSAYGDLIAADVLMQHCCTKAPHAKITLFVDGKNATLLPYLQHYDNAVILPTRGNKYLYLLRAALKNRKQKFDLAISDKGSPSRMINLFLWALGAKDSIAYRENNWHGKLINCGVDFDPNLKGSCHHAAEILNLVIPNCREVPKKYYPKLSIPKNILTKSEPKINQALSVFKKKPGPLILISTSNNREDATLGVARHAQILNTLYKKQPCKIVISYLEKNTQEAMALTKELKAPTLPLFTNNFADFMVLLKNVDLVFVGEGGIMHLATALGKKTLGLFGRSSLASWEPLGKYALYLADKEDVKKISVEKIIGKLRDLIL
jgi:ADP-heptose:LPS heptosyltransferase